MEKYNFKKVWHLLGELDKWKFKEESIFADCVIHESGVYTYMDEGICFHKGKRDVYTANPLTWIILGWRIGKLRRHLKKSFGTPTFFGDFMA